jgi:hypothetical protein
VVNRFLTAQNVPNFSKSNQAAALRAEAFRDGLEEFEKMDRLIRAAEERRYKCFRELDRYERYLLERLCRDLEMEKT